MAKKTLQRHWFASHGAFSGFVQRDAGGNTDGIWRVVEGIGDHVARVDIMPKPLIPRGTNRSQRGRGDSPRSAEESPAAGENVAAHTEQTIRSIARLDAEHHQSATPLQHREPEDKVMTIKGIPTFLIEAFSLDGCFGNLDSRCFNSHVKSPSGNFMMDYKAFSASAEWTQGGGRQERCG